MAIYHDRFKDFRSEIRDIFSTPDVRFFNVVFVFCFFLTEKNKGRKMGMDFDFSKKINALYFWHLLIIISDHYVFSLY